VHEKTGNIFPVDIEIQCKNLKVISDKVLEINGAKLVFEYPCEIMKCNGNDNEDTKEE
jgi:hypothetical protein